MECASRRTRVYVPRGMSGKIAANVSVIHILPIENSFCGNLHRNRVRVRVRVRVVLILCNYLIVAH